MSIERPDPYPADWPALLPGEHFRCPECGTHAEIDEDGCCLGCGADCEVERCLCATYEDKLRAFLVGLEIVNIDRLMADGSVSDFQRLGERIAELTKVLLAKRSVDGLNGRTWDASAHLLLDQRIEAMGAGGALGEDGGGR